MACFGWPTLTIFFYCVEQWLCYFSEDCSHKMEINLSNWILKNVLETLPHCPTQDVSGDSELPYSMPFHDTSTIYLHSVVPHTYFVNTERQSEWLSWITRSLFVSNSIKGSKKHIEVVDVGNLFWYKVSYTAWKKASPGVKC